MLILTRRPQESLVIGSGRITVTVLEVHAGRIRLGIDAPQEVKIRRSEAPPRDALSADAAANVVELTPCG
jgi:carbon storage regulator